MDRDETPPLRRLRIVRSGPHFDRTEGNVMTTEPDTLTCSRCGVDAPRSCLTMDYFVGPVHPVRQGCIDALRAELAVMREDRNACLEELDTMSNERFRMEGEIATLSGPRVASDAMVEAVARELCAMVCETTGDSVEAVRTFSGARLTRDARRILTAALAASTEPTP